MNNVAIRFVLALMVLVFGAAAEELLPKALGVGFPVLLASLPVIAMRPPTALSVIFALAAGAVEDSLSGLPFMTSASYFLLVVALVKWSHLPAAVAAVAFPAYQAWLCLWVTGLQGSVFGRILLAIPFGMLAYGVVAPLLAAVERRAAVDEEG